MGDFDDNFFKIADGLLGGEFTKNMADYNVNQKRPSITTLSFSSVPESKVEEIKNVKTGLFSGGNKKKLMASILEGRTTYAEVLILAREDRIVDRSEDPRNNRHKFFYKVADIRGNVIREDVPGPDDRYAVTLELNGGNSASETGCADKVDPSGYMHAYVIHYYLKDDQYYVLLTKEQWEDMSIFVNNAGASWHFVEDGVGYKW